MALQYVEHASTFPRACAMQHECHVLGEHRQQLFRCQPAVGGGVVAGAFLEQRLDRCGVFLAQLDCERPDAGRPLSLWFACYRSYS